MLTWQQIKEMHYQGISFGAHTVNHVKLPELSEEKMRTELTNSKLDIEENLSINVKRFAYPYGLLNDTAYNMTQELATIVRFQQPGYRPIYTMKIGNIRHKFNS